MTHNETKEAEVVRYQSRSQRYKAKKAAEAAASSAATTRFGIDPVLTAEEVVEICRMKNLQTLYRLRSEGRAPRGDFLPGAGLRFRASDVNAWLDEHLAA